MTTALLSLSLICLAGNVWLGLKLAAATKKAEKVDIYANIAKLYESKYKKIRDVLAEKEEYIRGIKREKLTKPALVTELNRMLGTGGDDRKPDKSE